MTWRKSSYSNSNGECVEVADLPTGHAVRDTKDHGTGPVLRFSSREWAAFVTGVKNDEFDCTDVA
ncbi:DUF397 domain-containing protein [Pseudonocardia sp. CNS-139]|nr:DUF397 domain-containing protein [Pseudonocardia sp. CNS-139]